MANVVLARKLHGNDKGQYGGKEEKSKNYTSVCANVREIHRVMP